MEKTKETLVNYGKKLIEKKLTIGTGGNLSVRLKDTQTALITPSGVEYELMNPEDIVPIDFDGNVIGEHPRKPSSEYLFHIDLYKKRPDIQAIVHTHSTYATTIACLNWELPPVHYLVGYSGGKVPLAPYALFGSKELSDNICRNIEHYNAILLANHGLVALGINLPTAFSVAEEIELVSQIYYQTLCIGKPKILSEPEMTQVLEKFKTYGQKK